MKKLKFPLFLCLMALVAFSFSACSDDNDDDGKENTEVNVAQLVGMWEYDLVSGWEKKNGEIYQEYNNISLNDMRWDLKEDHTADIYECDEDNGQWGQLGTANWEYDNGTLRLYNVIEEGSQSEDYEYQIASQSKNKIVLSDHQNWEDGSDKFEAYEEITLIRVR